MTGFPWTNPGGRMVGSAKPDYEFDGERAIAKRERAKFMAIDMTTIEGLTEIFRRHGARNPESWASSQINGGIPQLARFLFLKLAWQGVEREGDSNWIEVDIACTKKHPWDPYAGSGHALASLRAKGATDEELTELVRCKQAELLFHMCVLADGPYCQLQDLDPELAEEIGWLMAQTDAEENIVGVFGGLHESVLEMDPEGREVRPRGWVSETNAKDDEG